MSREVIEKILFIIGILIIIAMFFFLMIYYLTAVNSNNFFAIGGGSPIKDLNQTASNQYNSNSKT